MHQLWRHSNGVWYVRHGVRLRKRTSARTRDRAAAEIFLARFIAAESTFAPDAPNLRDILAASERDRLQRVRSKKTLSGCVAALTRHLGDLQPHHLTPPTMRRYAQLRGVSAGTIMREVQELRASLKWAVQHQWIAAAPKITMPVSAPPPRDRWLTRDEATRLLAACVEPHVCTFIMLGLMTAARSGAILELTWPQVDLERRIINFGRGWGNKRRAVVPMNDELYTHLAASKALAHSEFVVEWRGKRVFTVKTGFSQACRRAKLTDVSPHILRHTCATWQVIDGVPLAEVARFLGDSEATVEKVYGKHSPGYLRRAASAVQLGSPAA